MSDRYSFEQVISCVQALGTEETFTEDMLITLVQYQGRSDIDDSFIYSLIVLFGDKAFTDEAKKFMDKE